MKLPTLLVAGLLCGAPVVASAQIRVGVGINLGVPVREAPPAPRQEFIGAAPGPGYAWIGGHWAWRNGWVWMRGHWDRRAGYVWSPGHWDRRDGGYIWIEGQWVAPAPVVYASPPPPAYGGEVVVQSPPPAAIVENYGPAPGPDYFYIGGRWAWQGRWVWLHGHWDRHPHYHQGAAWVGGHWENRHGGYVWMEGHWR
jgi:hypothetical protein